MSTEVKSNNEAKPNHDQHLFLIAIPIGIGMNLAIGTLVSILKLPVFLDAIGTITVTLLLGIRAGITTGVLSFLIGGLLVNPAMPYFVGTQAAIALYTGLVAKRGLFKSWPRCLLAGIGLGVVAATVSAPIIVWLFGGITGSGSGFITAFLLASGKSVIKSVFLTGVACEPVDKAVQSVIALWLTRSLPKKIRTVFAAHSSENFDRNI